MLTWLMTWTKCSRGVELPVWLFLFHLNRILPNICGSSSSTLIFCWFYRSMRNQKEVRGGLRIRRKTYRIFRKKTESGRIWRAWSRNKRLLEPRTSTMYIWSKYNLTFTFKNLYERVICVFIFKLGTFFILFKFSSFLFLLILLVISWFFIFKGFFLFCFYERDLAFHSILAVMLDLDVRNEIFICRSRSVGH